MPISQYDRDFSPSGKKGSAAKAKQSMIAQYGLTKGLRVFYATARRNQRRKRHGRSS